MTGRKTACFTGHRHLPPDRLQEISALLSRAVSEAYADGYRDFYCGGALGFDTLAAQEVLKLRKEKKDIRLLLAIPCADQPARWSLNDQDVYQRIFSQANERTILFPDYTPGCFLARNRHMVDRSTLCICYLYSLRGGTAQTVRYAVSRDLRVVNLAMPQPASDFRLRESLCCSTFISPSAKRNAHIVLLSPLQAGKLKQKPIST